MRLVDTLYDGLQIVIILGINAELELIRTVDIGHGLDVVGFIAYIDVDRHECSQLGLDAEVHIPVTKQGDIGAHFLLGTVYFGYNVIIHILDSFLF